MRDRLRCLFAVVLLPLMVLPVLAEEPPPSPTVAIEGPKVAEVGELVVLAALAEGPGELRWVVIPPTPDFLAVEAGQRAVFSAREPGVFRFVLAAGFEGGRVALTDPPFVLEIGREPSPPEPDPEPEPDPPVPLAQLVRQWAETHAPAQYRASLARSLATGYRSVASCGRAGQCRSPEEMLARITAANRNVLAGREVAWRPFFEALRQHMNALEARGELATPAAVAAVFDQIAAGLDQVQ